MKKLAYIFCSVAILALTACASSFLELKEVQHVDLNTSCTIEEIRDSVIEAGYFRGWVFDEKGPNSLKGILNVRAHKLEIEVDYSESALDIKYISSENLLSPTGQIHSKYYNWINNLIHDTKLRTSVACNK